MPKCGYPNGASGLKGRWVPPDTRDKLVDFVNHWSERTEIALKLMVLWLGILLSKFYSWRSRYGKVNEHNAKVPRDAWLLDWERKAILDFETQRPTDGYRRLTFMMLDEDVVAATPSTVYRVLKDNGRIGSAPAPSVRKGKGFHQPDHPHKHWHLDISYLNVCGTFYYLISVLDGYSRFLVHWEIRESMTRTRCPKTVLQRAREEFPDVSPRIITDNGPQFIARDLKEFIRLTGMTHVRTSPYCPQSNGKLERWHGTIKRECIRPGTPLSLEDARRIVTPVCRALQYQPLAQCHWLCDSGG